MLRVALEIDRQVLVEVKVRAGSDGEFRGRRAANECCLCRSVSHPWDASHVTFQWAARSNGTGTGEGYCAARRRVAKIRSLLVWSILSKYLLLRRRRCCSATNLHIHRRAHGGQVTLSPVV